MSPPLLSLRGISKSYGQIRANQAIDLDVAPQSIHAILGENGAGKSTLMKLIYGVEQPDDGTVVWNGEPLSLASPAEARRRGIGMVFQHFSLFETLTVVENIQLVVPGSKAELAGRIRSLGQDFGLEVDPLADVHALSVGERQRVEIIRCLMTDPKLLILDEPTSVLPPQAVKKLFDTLRRLRGRGVSILFISHKLEEIRTICDHATILRGGRVIGTVDPRDHDAHDLARMMIGRDMPEVMPALAMPEGEKRLEIIGMDYTPDDPFATPLSGISLTVRSGEILGIAGLSGGNLQKFIVGREMMLSPKLLFVAQPTWGVDIGAASAIRRRLIALRNEGMAILVISEELEELFELCDFIQVLHHGMLSPPLVTRDTRPEDIGRYMIGAHASPEKVPA
ncbi:ATP-binding cassette domain-containing protein [Mesorhizobium sp. M1409]|uniref:ABC transporter ATP-binding protein n=1 Tax=unclassified Mesorhizobium TaxID=325217 RepID=UPI00333A5309